MTASAKLERGTTVDPGEVERFGRLGAEWWDPKGPMRALHKLNPVRVGYVRELLCRFLTIEGKPLDCRPDRPLDGVAMLDIGCGAGLLAEPLARQGARMTAIDPSRPNIEVAKEHAAKAGLEIDYRCTNAAALAREEAKFDAVLAMEVIEHVRNVRLFVKEAAAMVRPGGMLFAATLNRTWKSFAFGLVAAEYVLGWVPRGTHDWNHFITPEELAAHLRCEGLRIKDETGVSYDPLRGRWRLSRDMDINYMIAAQKPG